MSVRVTPRLIGDLVVVTALPKGPQMIVQDIDEENKMVTAVWFSDSNEYQEGFFPGAALDRVEVKGPAKAKAAPGKKGGRK
ncbi:MAG: hypothetical protein FWH12_03385 [Treponema sp.]|nr:hypothetical protein [Treponema sp.]